MRIFSIEQPNEDPSADRLNRIAARLKRGDASAGEETFRYFSPLLYRFFASRTGNRALSEDLTQDAFIKIVGKIDTFDETKGNFPGWVWQIARNTLIDHYREKKEISFADAGEGIEHIATHDAVDEQLRVKAIMSAVARLSEEDQELFSLRFVSDVSYREISQLTGKSETALRVALHRINKKVKDIVREV